MGYIVKPLVTEKMNSITEKFPNRFGFIVRPEANKLEIKKEIDRMRDDLSDKLYDHLYAILFEHLFNALYVPEPEDEKFVPLI